MRVITADLPSMPSMTRKFHDEAAARQEKSDDRAVIHCLPNAAPRALRTPPLARQRSLLARLRRLRLRRRRWSNRRTTVTAGPGVASRGYAPGELARGWPACRLRQTAAVTTVLVRLRTTVASLATPARSPTPDPYPQFPLRRRAQYPRPLWQRARTCVGGGPPRITRKLLRRVRSRSFSQVHPTRVMCSRILSTLRR